MFLIVDKNGEIISKLTNKCPKPSDMSETLYLFTNYGYIVKYKVNKNPFSIQKTWASGEYLIEPE